MNPMRMPRPSVCLLLSLFFPCALLAGTACEGDPTAPPGSDASAPGEQSSSSDSGAHADAPSGDAADSGASPPSRPVPVACSRVSPRPAANAASDGGAGASIECHLDSECTTKPDGRCNELWSGGIGVVQHSLGTRCTYDACTEDDDCGAAICGCGVGFGGQNVCLPQSNCRVDADCAQGRFCSFSYPPVEVEDGAEQGGGHGTLIEGLGWFCTTASDECVPGQVQVPNGEHCVFAPTVGWWIWWYQP